MTDFKGALDAWSNKKMSFFTNGMYYNTVKQALLIADKLMQGPSDDVSMAGIRERMVQNRKGDSDTDLIFTAMRDQMLKEIDSEKA